MTDCIADTRERIKIMQALVDGQPIEYTNRYPVYGPNSDRKKIWQRVETPQWNWSEYDYRIAEIEDSIDWTAVDPKFNYLARDEDGLIYLFQNRPTASWGKWKSSASEPKHGWGLATLFASCKPGNKRWDLSLVTRPGHVEPEKEKG